MQLDRNLHSIGSYCMLFVRELYAIRSYLHAIRSYPYAIRSYLHAIRSYPYAIQSYLHAIRSCPNAIRSYLHAIRSYPNAIRSHLHAIRLYPYAIKSYAIIYRTSKETVFHSIVPSIRPYSTFHRTLYFIAWFHTVGVWVQVCVLWDMGLDTHIARKSTSNFTTSSSLVLIKRILGGVLGFNKYNSKRCAWFQVSWS